MRTSYIPPVCCCRGNPTGQKTDEPVVRIPCKSWEGLQHNPVGMLVNNLVNTSTATIPRTKKNYDTIRSQLTTLDAESDRWIRKVCPIVIPLVIGWLWCCSTSWLQIPSYQWSVTTSSRMNSQNVVERQPLSHFSQQHRRDQVRPSNICIKISQACWCNLCWDKKNQDPNQWISWAPKTKTFLGSKSPNKQAWADRNDFLTKMV